MHSELEQKDTAVQKKNSGLKRGVSLAMSFVIALKSRRIIKGPRAEALTLPNPQTKGIKTAVTMLQAMLCGYNYRVNKETWPK